MSNQSTTHRVDLRRNGSPSISTTTTMKQGPLKAVKAFSLKSSLKGIADNKEKQATATTPWSPDSRNSPERKSPRAQQHHQSQSPQSHSQGHGIHIHNVVSVPVSQVHKDMIHKGSRRSPVPGKWRASSADTVVPSYLTGQWPKDINSYHYQSSGVFMCDKSTQTVDAWDGKLNKKHKKGHRRSASFGQGDQLKLHVIKQHLQKSKGSKQRSSPVFGNHSALSLTAPPALGSQTKAILISAGHIPRSNMKLKLNRFQRSSVEELNIEIEKLISPVKGVTLTSSDGEDCDQVFKDIPDGHRAPLPEVSRLSSTRNVDTQTPSSQGEGQLSSSRPASITPPRPRSRNSASRSDSSGSKSSKGDLETSPEPVLSVASPKLEKSCPFVREPPDGCEKVTVVEESRRPQIKEPMLFSPVKPNQFVFKQSQDSAFCPLIKLGPMPPYSPVASPTAVVGDS